MGEPDTNPTVFEKNGTKNNTYTLYVYVNLHNMDKSAGPLAVLLLSVC